MQSVVKTVVSALCFLLLMLAVVKHRISGWEAFLVVVCMIVLTTALPRIKV